MTAHPSHRSLAGLSPTLHVSHRGGASLAPENTLHAFRQALARHRTDVLELDVQATRDGVLVVHHDETLERCTDGRGAVAAMDWSELRRLDAAHHFTLDGGATFPLRGQGIGVPRFDELLAALPDVRLNVELKAEAAGAADVFAAALRAADALDRVWIGSESDALGARLVAALPEACHFYPRDALTIAVMALKSGGELAADDPYTVLDMPLHFHGLRLVDPSLVTAARERGRWLNVWTVNDEAEMHRCVADGVGGVMTDRPDLLRRVLDHARV